MNKTLYGEYADGRQSAFVRILELADRGCNLEADASTPLFDGDVSLWIGAVGPFAATATRKDAFHMALRFREPLDTKIIAHFNCS